MSPSLSTSRHESSAFGRQGSAERLSQTNEMISKDLYGTQAWRVNEIGPYDEGHDDSRKQGGGRLFGLHKIALPYKEKCEGIWTH